MKTIRLMVCLSVMLFITACKEKVSDGNLIVMNVTADYPEKEMVLQDFAEVEYIPLETTDEFLTQGVVMDMGEKYIVAKNWVNDGDIFLFDRKTGKAIRKINRKGQGGEEYTRIYNITLDEKHEELFVVDGANVASTNIYVYDFQGRFKRNLTAPNDAVYVKMFNYNDTSFICYDYSIVYEDGKVPPKDFYHAVVSKQDGDVIYPLSIPFEKINTSLVEKGGMVAVGFLPSLLLHPDKSWLLMETSSDTIYQLLPDEKELQPFIVKTPAVNEPEIFLQCGVITSRYCFLATQKKDLDVSTGRAFFKKNYVYDIDERAFYQVKVMNGDFLKEKTADMMSHPLNTDILAYETIQADVLTEAYEEGKLQGKLKEIAAGLKEDDNPVLALYKSK